MIVDDDPSIRYLLSRILIDEGYEAVSAAGAHEGLIAADKNEFDLILLDLNMAGMSGREMLKSLALRHSAVPVVIITACAQEKGQGSLTGIAVYLQKPLDFPFLLETIRKALADSSGCKLSGLVRKD